MVANLLLLATFLATVNAFSPLPPSAIIKQQISFLSTSGIQKNNNNKKKTELFMGNTKQPPIVPPIRDISYGEESRKYRRTIFTHDDWVKFRSPDRFWRNLEAGTSSGIYKNVAKEILATTGVAATVVLYNGLVTGFQDFHGNTMEPLLQASFLPVLGLPLAPFTLSSPSLGLLLGTYVGVYTLYIHMQRKDGTDIRLYHVSPCPILLTQDACLQRHLFHCPCPCQSFVPIPVTNDGMKHEKTGV
jgi:Bestrophin, RFP-TM, chloride channel